VHKGAAWDAVDRGKEELSVAAGEPLRLELAAFLEACRPARAARLGRTVPLSEIRSA
jgi:hypothetical protein